MGEKDLSEKLLEDYNDVFSDIINVFIFQGKQSIKPEELFNSGVFSQYRADDGKLHELERDIAKHWKSGEIDFAIIGLENQTKVEKFMSFRVMAYDGNSYRTQLLKKTNTIVPVITIVLYFGTDRHWNTKKNICSLMDIPHGLEEYVNDYKIHVFEIAWLTEEQINLFKSDFKVVANFFVNKRKNPTYVPTDTTEIIHVDEFLKLLSAMTGDQRYEIISKDPELMEGVHNMCDVAERLEKRGRAEGRIEERKTSIRNMLADHMPYEKIKQYTNATDEQIDLVKTEMSQNHCK